jgi:hypothetical protein
MGEEDPPWLEDYVECVSAIQTGSRQWELIEHMFHNLPDDMQGSILGECRTWSFMHGFPHMLAWSMHVLMSPASTYESLEHASGMLWDLSIRDPIAFRKLCDTRPLEAILEELSYCTCEAALLHEGLLSA